MADAHPADDSLAALRRAAEERPQDTDALVEYAEAIEERAWDRWVADDSASARADAETAAAIYRDVAARDAGEMWRVESVLGLLVDVARDLNDWTACLRASEEWAAAARLIQAREDEGLGNDLGRALRCIADMHWKLNDFATARAKYEEALVYHRERAAADPDDAIRAGHVADLLDALAGTNDKLGDVALARRMYAEMNETYVAARRIHPQGTDLARSHRWGLEHAARFHERVDDVETALALREAQLGIARSIARSDPSTDSRDDVRFDLVDLGDLHVRRGENAPAVDAYREAVGIARALAAENPEDRDWLVSTAHPLAELRDVLVASGAKDEAVVAAREVVSLQRSIVAGDANDFEMLRELVVDLDELGDCLRAVGDDAGAAVAFDEAESIARGLVATDGSIARWRDDLYICLGRRARVALDRGDATTAAAGFAAAAEEARVLVAMAPDVVKWRRKLGQRLSDVGEARTAAGEHEGALVAYEEAVPLLVATRGDTDGVSAEELRDTLHDAADAASAAGRPDRAVAFRELAGDVAAPE